jgi:flap endonuclease-1
MGIKFLNNIFREQCDKSIWQIGLAELSGKKIAVDISIYLYKYESTDTLIENIYLMLATFRASNIIPIFVFDGKPPPEKKALLQKRRDDKTAAKNEYNKLKNQLLERNNENKDKEIEEQMDQLKKQFVYITHEKIEKVKDLIRAYGATYYDAPGEADEICALLVIKKKVWACLSEDMDLFVYGCNRVLRYLSLTNQSVVLYYTKGILEQLNMTQNEFREICVLSGTDYNMNVNIKSISLYETIKLFRKYKEEPDSNNMTFYDWIRESKLNFNFNLDLELLKKINDMFDLFVKNELKNEVKNELKNEVKNELKNELKNEVKNELKNEVKNELKNEVKNELKNIKIYNGPIQKLAVRDILKEDGFLFIN